MIHDDVIQQLQKEIAGLQRRRDEYITLARQADETVRTDIDVDAIAHALIQGQAVRHARENIQGRINTIERKIKDLRQKQQRSLNELAGLKQRRALAQARLESSQNYALGAPPIVNRALAEIAETDQLISAAEAAIQSRA